MTDANILRADFSYAKMQESIGSNGKPWGYSANRPKRAWWKIWKSAAM